MPNETPSWYEQEQKSIPKNLDNFAFVKDIDEELYRLIHEAEQNVLTNTVICGNTLRKALEYFAKEIALPGELKRKLPTNAELKDYENIYRGAPQLGVSAERFEFIRRVGNACSHQSTNGQLPKREYRATYDNITKALDNMYNMLIEFCRKRYGQSKHLPMPTKVYSKNKQPYGNKIPCLDIPTTSESPCEKQVLCISKSPVRISTEKTESRNEYSILRIYNGSDVTKEWANRDAATLHALEKEQPPQSVVKFSLIETSPLYGKYIISYDFGTSYPFFLSSVVRKLTNAQVYKCMFDIASGLSFLHDRKIYHRHLQPESIFINYSPDSDRIFAKIAFFEYSKITGNGQTVFANVRRMAKRNSSSPFMSIPTRQILSSGISDGAERINWRKEDVYAAGALFCFMLNTPLTPQGLYDVNKIPETHDESLRLLVASMLDQDEDERPEMSTVSNRMTQICLKHGITIF